MRFLEFHSQVSLYNDTRMMQIHLVDTVIYSIQFGYDIFEQIAKKGLGFMGLNEYFTSAKRRSVGAKSSNFSSFLSNINLILYKLFVSIISEPQITRKCFVLLFPSQCKTIERKLKLPVQKFSKWAITVYLCCFCLTVFTTV